MSWVPYPWEKKMTPMNVGEEGDFFIPSVKDTPVLVRDLIGRQVRVIKPGDQVTMDFRPGRVNIRITEDYQIEDIAFG